jgi:Uma2 family endonuclease
MTAMSGLDEFQDQKFLLIDGELYEMPAPGPLNTYCLQILMRLFTLLLGQLHSIRPQSSLTVDEFTNPQPDLCIVVGADADYRNIHPKPRHVSLLIEVSDTTLRFDLGPKSHLYAAAGIADYWVVDLNNRLLHVHRDPVADEAVPRGYRYSSVQILTVSESIAPLAATSANIKVADTLP